MKKIFILMIGIHLCCVSCHKNSSNEVCLSENSYSTMHMNQFGHIISTGDVEMYDSIFDKYTDDGAMDAMLSVSIIMANKYNYAKAYLDVYDILTSIYQIYGYNNDSIDSATLRLANYFLEQSKRTEYANILTTHCSALNILSSDMQK